MQAFSTIGIIGKRDDTRAATTLTKLVELLGGNAPDNAVQSVLVSDDSPYEISIDSSFKAVEVVSRDQIARRSDLLIVVGGDGTLLGAARSAVAHEVPILGINHGRLGFLVEVSPEEIKTAIALVLQGRYFIAKRLVLLADVQRSNGGSSGPTVAINDIVIRSRASIRMIEFETWLSRDPHRPQNTGWEFISRHRADGMIVSTPTGSTAYALSGGGPVLHPALSAVALVPICPHTLTDRPIAVPASRAIRIVQLGPNDNDASMTCDGQINTALAPGDAVEIHRAPHPLHLIHPEGYSYFRLLRDKLLWGHGPEATRGPTVPGDKPA